MFHDDLWAYLGNNRRDRLYGKSLVKDLMLNDYCPELGRIMEALAEEGFAERISQAARFGKKDLFLIPVEEAREKLAGEGTFRQDLVNYAADSVSYAFEFLDEVQEVPEDVRDDPYDDLEKDYVPYEEQDEHYSVGFMLDIIYQFDDFLDELMLGRAYEYGDGIRQSYPRAMKWFRRSADYGIAEAMVEIGNMYRCGSGVRKDSAEAERWYRKAAERHKDWSDLAEDMLRSMQKSGKITDLTGLERVKWLTDADARGNGSAARQLGDMYAHGDGIAQDFAEAMRWYLKGAEDGDPKSMIALGLMYRNGEGVPVDYEKAAGWLLKASQSRFELEARYYLGMMYREGKGVKRDPAMALRLLRSAAAFDDPEAEIAVAEMYENGEGVPQDLREAVKWYGRTLWREIPEIQFRLGKMCRDGRGTERNPEKAEELLRAAARKGHRGAAEALAAMGIGSEAHGAGERTETAEKESRGKEEGADVS